MPPEFIGIGTRETEQWRQRVERLIERRVIQGPVDPKYIPNGPGARQVDHPGLGRRGLADLLAMAPIPK
jgi:hypothetical protein